MVEARTRYVIMIKTMLGRKTYVTSAALAEAAGVSVRTVKYDLKELQSFLKEYGVEIESKRSYGYRLLVGDGSDMEGLSKALRANLPFDAHPGLKPRPDPSCKVPPGN